MSSALGLRLKCAVERSKTDRKLFDGLQIVYFVSDVEKVLEACELENYEVMDYLRLQGLLHDQLCWNNL